MDVCCYVSDISCSKKESICSLNLYKKLSVDGEGCGNGLRRNNNSARLSQRLDCGYEGCKKEYNGVFCSAECILYN